jgi:Flp pilus assembly protein TadG
MISIMLVIVVTDISTVYLARRSVASAADGAALAAVQRIDEQAIYTSTEQFDSLPLDQVADTVAQYQLQADPSGRTELTATLADPTTVRVEGSRVVELPAVGILGIGPVTVVAAAEAQSLVRVGAP